MGGNTQVNTNTQHDPELRGSLAAFERDLLETQVSIRRGRRWALARRGDYQALAAGEREDERLECAFSEVVEKGRGMRWRLRRFTKFIHANTLKGFIFQNSLQ